MYFVFTPNKFFAQYRMEDFSDNSTDHMIIFTRRTNFSLKKYLSKKNQVKRKEEDQLIAGERVCQTKLEEFTNYSAEIQSNSSSKSDNLISGTSTHSGSNFGFIPNDREERNSWIEKNRIDLNGIYEHMNHSPDFDGIIGKHIPFRELLNGVDYIESRYTAGLIHQVYLNKLNIVEKLKEFGLVKIYGFTLKVFILTIYFLFFIKCNSIESFKTINSKEFSVLIDNLSKPGPSSLLKFLKLKITDEIVEKFHNHIYNYISHLDPDLCVFLFIDEHLVQYQGRKKLSKGKSGTKNKVEKCFFRYYLTSPIFTCPVFCTLEDGSSRLEPEFFDILDEFEAGTGMKYKVLIFDRGIKSPNDLKKLRELGKHFICWGIPFKEVQTMLKRRIRLKMEKISTKIEELISLRSKNIQDSHLTPEEKDLKRVIARILPLSYLREQYLKVKAKEEKKKKWGAHDIIGIRDVDIEYKELDKIRTIVIETNEGSKFAIFTSIKREIAHEVEILLILKKRQIIDNFFSYKKAIDGDHIFTWDLKEKEVQKTKIGNIITQPIFEKLNSFQSKLKKANNKLKKLEKEYKIYKMQLKNKSANKNTIKNVLKNLEIKINLKQDLIRELKAFIRWSKVKKRPKYFDQFEIVMTPDFRIMKFINTINDLYFVISRQIAIDWANSLSIIRDEGIIEIKEREIEEFRNMMPDTLNQILLNGGGKIYTDENKKNGIIIELNCEYILNDENLIAPFLTILNSLDTKYLHHIDSSIEIKFTSRIERPLKSVKII